MNQIILAPRSFHSYLRKCYHQDDIFKGVKLFTIEDILNKVFGKIDDKFLFTLLVDKKFSYFKSKKFMKYLPFIINDKTNEEKLLSLLLDEAKQQNMLDKDEYVNVLLKDTIHVYGYSEDDRLLNYLKKLLNLSLEFKTLNFKENKQTLYKFNLLEDEIIYVFNMICELYSNNVSLDDIYIYGVDENNIDLVLKYAKRYKIPFNGLSDFNAFKSPFYRDFINQYKINKDFEASKNYVLEKYVNNDTASNILDFLAMHFNEQFDFEIQLDVFNNVIKQFKEEQDKKSPAINFLNNLQILENKYLFILDFSSDKYPLIHLDNDYLSDEIKMHNHIYTSKEKNAINKNEMLTFLKANNETYLFFAFKHLTNNFYLSYLVDDLNIQVKEIINNFDYSIKTTKNALAKLKDVERKYGIKESLYNSLDEQLKLNEYKNYDNSYKKFNVIKEDEKLYLSYSSLSQYNSCPFKYYLSKILSIDTLDDTFSLDLGSLAHYIFENGVGKDEDFEKLFCEAKSKFNFDIKHSLIIDNLKDYFSAALSAMNEHYRVMLNPMIYTEKTCYYKIDDNTFIKGKIDKALITCDEHKYLWLIDYKTGINTFNIEKARKNDNLQLPTYLLLSSTDKELGDIEIGGIYYQNVLPNKIISPAKSPNLAYLRLEGVSVRNEKSLNSFETNYTNNEKSIYVNLPPYNEKAFNDKKYFIDENDIKELKEIVLNNFKNMNENLRDNNFIIQPKKSGENAKCKYCGYKEICFYKNEK